MMAFNRSVMVKLLQQPSTKRANGGATDHDHPGFGSVEGDPSGAATQADVVPSGRPACALGPADRTMVCTGADRRTQRDRASLAGPALESSVASGTTGQGPGAG